MKLTKFLCTLLAIGLANVDLCRAEDEPKPNPQPVDNDGDGIPDNVMRDEDGNPVRDADGNFVLKPDETPTVVQPEPKPEPKPNAELQGAANKVKELIKHGCNFYEREDLGIMPFSKIKKDEATCEVVLKENTEAFMYACDGTSDPPQCPTDVKTEQGVVKLETFFTQATITDASANYPDGPKVFHVITGKAHRDFTATCECTRASGAKETMKLTSGFKTAGIAGILGSALLFLAKI